MPKVTLRTKSVPPRSAAQCAQHTMFAVNHLYYKILCNETITRSFKQAPLPAQLRRPCRLGRRRDSTADIFRRSRRLRYATPTKPEQNRGRVHVTKRTESWSAPSNGLVIASRKGPKKDQEASIGLRPRGAPPLSSSGGYSSNSFCGGEKCLGAKHKLGDEEK